MSINQMKNIVVIVTLILLIVLTLGCIGQNKDSSKVNTATANTQLKLNSTTVAQGDFCSLMCQLNMTRGAGLNNKTIVWSLDNNYKGTSRTIWGYATYNLTAGETSQLSVGVHIVNASFEGDADYVASKSTATLQVNPHAPAVTPSASPTSASSSEAFITLNVPSNIKFGCMDITGTHSGITTDKTIYILIKPEKSENWLVEQYPLVFVNGTYACRVCFDKPSGKSELKFEITAVITSEKLAPNSEVKDLPNADAQTSTTVTVKG
jgi:hypothetical protein